jgi:hypothetical protein
MRPGRGLMLLLSLACIAWTPTPRGKAPQAPTPPNEAQQPGRSEPGAPGDRGPRADQPPISAPGTQAPPRATPGSGRQHEVGGPDRVFPGEAAPPVASTLRPGAPQPGGGIVAGGESEPDSLPGVCTTCRDFRSGLALAIQAQHVHADGTITPDTSLLSSRLCVGSAQGVASRMIPDGAGGGIVVWVDNRMEVGDLYAQHLAAVDSLWPGWPGDGVPVCVARGSQYGATLASDGAGGAIVAWTDFRAGGAGDIYAQRLTSAGEPAWGEDGEPICVHPADQGSPALVADGDGGALIVWRDRRRSVTDLFFQHLTSSGEPAAGALAGGDTLVTSGGDPTNPTLTSDGEGGAILIWETRRDTLPGILALRLNASGQPAAGWPTAGVRLSTTPGRMRHPVAVGDGAHGAIVAWADSTGIRAQRVSGAGQVEWPTGGVLLCGPGGAPAMPAIVSGDSLGGAIVAWEDRRSGNRDIYARRITDSGVPQWAENGVALCVAGGDQYAVMLAPDGAGGALATWVDGRSEAFAGYLALQAAHAGPAPKLEAVEVGPGRARFTWRTSTADKRVFSFQRCLGDEAWQSLSALQAATDGLLVAEDRTVPVGSRARYGLSVKVGEEQQEIQFAPVEVKIPLPRPLALRFARSEERGHVVRVALTLETNEAARLELFDVAGRRVLAREFGDLGAGDHEVQLRLPGYVRSGMYFIRLGQGRVTRTDRVVVLQ